MTELWKTIPGYGGHYEASTYGRIRSKDRMVVRKHPSGKLVNFFYRGRLLSPCSADKYQHKTVHLGVDKRKYSASVHRLVLLTFVGPCPDGMECCHSNGDASDNRLENLRWDTHQSNNNDRKLHNKYAIGERHHMSKLTIEQVREIRQSTKRRKDLCRLYNLSPSQIHRIRTNQSWTDI